MIRQVMRQDSVLAGKRVLIVDDDVRNIFALSSTLESYQMEVFYAEDGRKASSFYSRPQALMWF